LEKTFFVMPAEQFYRRVPGIKKLTSDYRRMWAAGQARYKILSLPPYEPQGQILQVVHDKVTTYLVGESAGHANNILDVKRDIAALQARLEELVEQYRIAP
jgi:hypothetical protein